MTPEPINLRLTQRWLGLHPYIVIEQIAQPGAPANTTLDAAGWSNDGREQRREIRRVLKKARKAVSR